MSLTSPVTGNREENGLWKSFGLGGWALGSK